MFKFLDKKNIEEVQEKIVKDYSAKTKTAYILPFKFTKPKKLNNSTYRVEMEAVRIKDKYYPAEVFSTIEMIDGEMVYLLNYDYESLGVCYKLLEGEILCGIKCDLDNSDVEMISFDIDVKNKTYKVAGESVSEKQIQPGE